MRPGLAMILPLAGCQWFFQIHHLPDAVGPGDDGANTDAPCTFDTFQLVGSLGISGSDPSLTEDQGVLYFTFYDGSHYRINRVSRVTTTDPYINQETVLVSSGLGDDTDPAISGDNLHLLFRSTRGAPAIGPQVYEVLLVNGMPSGPLTVARGLEGLVTVGGLDVSVDGNTLYVQTTDGNLRQFRRDAVDVPFVDGGIMAMGIEHPTISASQHELFGNVPGTSTVGHWTRGSDVDQFESDANFVLSSGGYDPEISADGLTLLVRFGTPGGQSPPTLQVYHRTCR